MLPAIPETVRFGVACAACLVAGIGYCGIQLLPQAMLADTLAVDAAESGQRRAGLLSGLWSAAETVSSAAGASIYGFVLAASGFDFVSLRRIDRAAAKRGVGHRIRILRHLGPRRHCGAHASGWLHTHGGSGRRVGACASVGRQCSCPSVGTIILIGKPSARCDRENSARYSNGGHRVGFVSRRRW